MIYILKLIIAYTTFILNIITNDFINLEEHKPSENKAKKEVLQKNQSKIKVS